MKYNYGSKIYFIFVTTFLFCYSCASNKPNETKNHPEIEKLWIEYFNNLNNNKFDKAVSCLNESVHFAFNSTGIDIDGHDNLKIQLKRWKYKLDKNNLYLKFHDIESIRIRSKMTMVDVKQGEYESRSNEMVREIRRYYHFYNFDKIGWKLYMIADARMDN